MALAQQLPTQGNNLAVNSYYAPATQIEQQQVLRNNAEMQARSQTFQQAASWNGKGAQPSKIDSNVAEGTVKPIWLGDALVLARRVMVNGQSYIQGCWLNWNSIRQSLLNSVQDLLPGADLLPAKGGQPESQAELLAALPLRLIAPKPRFEGAPGFWTPVRLSLAVAWACVLLAAAAVAGLLYGTVSLSERRADFVSAVTHELRTPLTTFKMYSEMLAEGMVPDEQKRRAYLGTLCSEANRLSHLVENVLAYARLETIWRSFLKMNVLSFTDASQAQFTHLRRQCPRLQTMDLRIASIALATSATLLSRNLRDFRPVPGLTVEDWTA